MPSRMRARGPSVRRALVRRGRLLCVVACCALSSQVLAAQALSDTLHAPSPSTGAVYGTVSLATGTPVVHARIEAVGTHDTTFSDSLGSYTIAHLPAGTRTLQITRADLDPLTIQVIVPGTGKLHVDVILSQSVVVAPARLSPVHVKSSQATALDTDVRAPVRIPGTWEWTGNIQDASETSGEPDALRLLAGDPREMMRPDGYDGTAVNAATGSLADRVFVDGLPMWNAVHGLGALTAIDPDVVSGIKISDGSASARSDDALFETADLQTRETTLTKPSFGTGFGPTTMRAWWADPIRVGTIDGQLLVAARRNSDAMTSARSNANSVTDRWGDGLTVLSIHHGRSNVRLVAVGSGDRLVADMDEAAVGAKSDATLVTSSDHALRVPWQSMTVGGVWTEQLSPSYKLLTRAWNAEFTAGTNAGAAPGVATMSNRARDVGFASELDLASFAIGASIEKIHTSYAAEVSSDDSLPIRDIEHAGTGSMFARTTHYGATADPAVIAAYAERRWGDVGGHWFAMSGVHLTSLSGRTPNIEPRLSVSVDLGKRMWMTAGYADTHQFVQALRDIRLTPGALVPVGLPIAAGSSGVPVAAARTLTADVSKNLGFDTRVTVDAYDRKFDGLILPTSTTTPRAFGDAFDAMDGQIFGYGGAVRSTIQNLSLQVTYGFQHAILTRTSAPYPLPRETAQTTSAIVELRARPTTTLKILGSFGSSFLGIQSPANADADGAGANVREEDGIPEARTLSAVGLTSDPLPTYMRVDMGVSHEWRATRAGRIILTTTLANIFDRSNVVALPPRNERDGQRFFGLTPRSLMVGITWRR
ncbi:MAG: carboxypeptidase-like regulatory domain-containing protein [Gemmatimonadota bacterium]